ncbi:MAG TPA: hypothetical protein VM076_05925 [Gemmatimonadaceae bacterium]|nr:hypothetical protein [Gemmatimonadaceae bacterium]
MRRLTAAGLLIASLMTVGTSPVASQGLGDRLRKKAADAVKGKDDKGKTVAKDEGPITSQFEKECGPLDRDAIDRFLKGLQAERAERATFESRRQEAKPDAQVRACEQKEAMGSEALRLMQRGMTEGASTDQMQAAMQKNRTDLETHIRKTCGEPVSKYSRFDANAAASAGAKAAGMSDNCYNKLKEVALFFCKGLTREQQKAATDQGIRAPGKGNAVWIFTADEAIALLPRCGQLVETIEATGTKLL